MNISELEERVYSSAEKLFGADVAQTILATLSDHYESLSAMHTALRHILVGKQKDEAADYIEDFVEARAKEEAALTDELHKELSDDS